MTVVVGGEDGGPDESVEAVLAPPIGGGEPGDDQPHRPVDDGGPGHAGRDAA